jgi:uncharacterized protein
MHSKLDYGELVNKAMYYVVREALMLTSKEALEGEHHFLITFSTGAEQVKIPERLKEKYSDKLTIVLQHQFYDLTVYEDAFSVTLSFDGKLESLFVPFTAISRFADPSVPFHLCFQSYEGGQTKLFGIGLPAKTSDASNTRSKIVSLDEFRKNREGDKNP